MGHRRSEPGVRAAASRAWHRLGDPAALSQPAAWWFAPVGFMGPVLVDPLRLGGSPAFWFAVALAGQFVVALGFWVGQRVVVRLPRPLGPFGTLGVVIVVVITRGVLLAWMTQVGGYSADLELFYRTIGSIPLIGGALILSGLVASVRSEHRATMQTLEEQREQLQVVQATLDGRLAEIRDQLRQQVAATLDPQIRALEAALGAAAAGRQSVPLSQLQALVDHDVRDLIDELGEDRDLPVVSPPPVRSHGRQRGRLPTSLAMSKALRPVLQGVIVGAAATASVSRALQPVPAITYCLVLAFVTAAVLAVARLLLARWSPPTLVALIAATALGGAATWSAVVIVAAAGVASPDSLRAGGLAYGAACGLGLAIYGAVDDHRASLEADLATIVGDLTASTSTLRRRSWVARRRLSLLLHGSVQSALHAAILRLGANPTPRPEDILRARDDVAAAFALLNAPPVARVPISVTLEGISTTWAGHCDVTWSVSDQARGRLETDTETCECVAEIAREATHNAIVHGHATEVSIAITCREGRTFVSVRDNGRLSSGEPGTGTAMLDEMCSSWSRTPTPDGTVLTSELMA